MSPYIFILRKKNFSNIKNDIFSYDEIPDGKDEDRYAETVSDLVEHPISLPPPTEPLAPTFLKVEIQNI